MKQKILIRLFVLGLVCCASFGTFATTPPPPVEIPSATLTIQEDLRPFFSVYDKVEKMVRTLERDWGVLKLTIGDNYEEDIDSLKALSRQLQNLTEALRISDRKIENFSFNYNHVFCSLTINPLGSITALEKVEDDERRLELWGKYWGSKVVPADIIAQTIENNYQVADAELEDEAQSEPMAVNIDGNMAVLAFNISGVNRYLEVLAEKGITGISVEGFERRPVFAILALGQRLRDLDLAIDRLTPGNMQARLKMNRVYIYAGKKETVEIEATTRSLNLYVSEYRLDPQYGHDTSYSEKIQAYIKEKDLLRLVDRKK